jgi:hypothetical protein
MSLKPKKSQTPSEPVNRKDELHGPWGRINAEPQSAVVLRLCKGNLAGEETTSYPYRVLSSWIWRNSHDQEELRIEAGPDVVTVQGHGLARVVDALDQGALETLREVPGDDVLPDESPIGVSSISITKTTDSLEER